MSTNFSYRPELMFRLLLERLSRGRVYRRSLPKTFGRVQLYVSPDAALKFLKPGSSAFDQRLLNIAQDFITRESKVWDVGANVGVFSFACASIATDGHVLAVEPDLFLASLIRRSLRLPRNRSLKVSVLPAAISEQSGIARFMIAKRGRASNFLEVVKGRSQAKGIRENTLVPTLSLDDLLQNFEPPTFIKIDVEGAEAMVLRGAERILTEFRPILFIEVGQEQQSEVGMLLASHGYQFFDGERPLSEQQPSQSPSWNTLAVPIKPLSH